MVASATPRARRGQRQKTTSVLGFDEKDESGRGYIVQSIRNPASERNLLDLSNRSNIPFNKTIEEVYSGVHDGPVLGFGASGIVRTITYKETGEQFAVKRLNMTLAVDSDEARGQLVDEIDIMCQVDHLNIVRLEEIYESDSIIYLVQELCYGGELFDRLDDQPNYRYPEDKTAQLVKQILASVSYLHSQGIVHRDLKLENFLFSTKDKDSGLKMIDFGLSKHFKYDQVHSEKVGTPYTVAPEIIVGKYDERCDVWSIGVITYMLLCGDSPFGGCDSSGVEKSLAEIRTNIMSGKLSFKPENIWKDVSQDAKDFIVALLTIDPNKRPTAREVRKLPFLRKYDNVNTDNQTDDRGGKGEKPCWLEGTPCFNNPLFAPLVAKLDKMKSVGFVAT